VEGGIPDPPLSNALGRSAAEPGDRMFHPPQIAYSAPVPVAKTSLPDYEPCVQPRESPFLRFAPPILIVAITLVAYLPALHAGFIWDDDDYVTNNATLQSPSALRDIWMEPKASPQYYPMVFTSFWIEYQLWGLHPLGYHLDNMLLHACAAILLWRVLARLEVPGALLAACAFAVHPINVESVAWVTERKNVLSAVFYFAAAFLYVAWASRPSGMNERSGATPEPREKSLSDWRYLISLLLFVLALLSKSVTCSLPAAILLVTWWKRGKLTRRDIVATLPMFALGLAMAIATAYLEIDHVRASGPEWNFSPVDRLLIAGRAVWFYATALVLPINLSFIYPKWTIDPRAAWQWAFPIGVTVALWALWRMRDRWGRGPLVAALFFIGTLVPALGFFNIYPMRYSFVADHFAYHASVGLIVLLAAGLIRFGRGAYFVLVPLVLLTLVRTTVYRDAESLWRDTLAKNPDSWMVNLNLAKTLVMTKQKSEAWPYFEAQVRLAPQLPETHWNYGSSLLQRGRFDEALAEYDEAIRLSPPEESFPQAYFGRGMVFMDQGRFLNAAAEFQRAVELKPDYTAAREQLNAALSRQHQSNPQGLPPG
jgi:tetratricopeptide (TPR) repeat protein